MRSNLALWKTIFATTLTMAAVIYAMRTKRPEGLFLHVPYDFRPPTIRRVRDRFWNPEDPRLFTPQVFGVGWSLNLYKLLELYRGYRNPPQSGEADEEPEP